MLKVLEPGDYFGNTVPRYTGAGLAIAETNFVADLVIPRHEHVNAFFCYVLGGRGTRAWPGRAAGEGGEAPMSLTFFPAAMPHQNCWYGAGGRVMHVEFDSAWLERLRDRTAVLHRAADFSGGAPMSVMRRLVHECAVHDCATPLAIEGLVLELLAACERSSIDASIRTSGNGAHRWLERAEAILREHCCEPLSLADIAAECHVSADHLARAFRKRYGCTIGARLRALRLEFAREQLERADMPIAAVAEAAGFADQSHFTRLFRRTFGLTPGAYRSLGDAGRLRSND